MEDILTALEKVEAEDLKLLMIAVEPYCRVCKIAPSVQLAHRIPQTKAMLKKYGKAIIHHRKNLVPVCGLTCNSAVNIQHKPIEIEKLVNEIEEYIANAS